MSDRELRAFLNLLMSSDPSPPSRGEHGELTESEAKTLRDMADREAMSRGFANWIDAYHLLGTP